MFEKRNKKLNMLHLFAVRGQRPEAMSCFKRGTVSLTTGRAHGNRVMLCGSRWVRLSVRWFIRWVAGLLAGSGQEPPLKPWSRSLDSL